MAMTFTPRENFESAELNVSPLRLTTNGKNVRFFAEKLSVPRIDMHVHRPRLDRLLRKSLEQTGAVLVTGRAATGKTALAANFARGYDRTIWYRVEAADSDWKVFSSYLFAGINNDSPAISEGGIAGFVEMLAREAESGDKPALLVLDDIHNVFDTGWFHEFFLTLLTSLSPDTHLICLTRSLPSVPLWRLRSKQVLSVLDEKVITLDEAETAEFCMNWGIPVDEAARLQAESFGRVGKLKALCEFRQEDMLEKS
jgi:ATP/maltotriose-dependent transcriptional regulator MalT